MASFYKQGVWGPLTSSSLLKDTQSTKDRIGIRTLDSSLSANKSSTRLGLPSLGFWLPSTWKKPNSKDKFYYKPTGTEVWRQRWPPACLGRVTTRIRGEGTLTEVTQPPSPGEASFLPLSVVQNWVAFSCPLPMAVSRNFARQLIPLMNY